MINQDWKKGWLNEILEQADQAVQSWPDWMRDPALRYHLKLDSSLMTIEDDDSEIDEDG